MVLHLLNPDGGFGDDLQDSVVWSSHPLVLLRDIHNVLLTLDPIPHRRSIGDPSPVPC
jgi:hypothetical protein